MKHIFLPVFSFFLSFGCNSETVTEDGSQFTGSLGSFTVKALTGPEKDKSLCYI